MKYLFKLGLYCVCSCWVITAGQTHAEQPSLLQMIAEWQYPDCALSGAQASDGETVDSNGDRTVPSIVCKTTMTTDASIEKVLAFYRAKLSPKQDGRAARAIGDAASGRSAVFSEDSAGRPFALHTVIVNEDNTSTTLVISRGKDESKTHIAWKHYRRFKQ